MPHDETNHAHTHAHPHAPVAGRAIPASLVQMGAGARLAAAALISAALWAMILAVLA